ncbi:MAG: hypothetical protein QXP01_07585, partial [Candidatus Hadarchaeum sp.]
RPPPPPPPPTAWSSSVAAGYKPWTSEDALAFLAREKVKYAQIIHELIQENFPEAKMSGIGPSDLAIPKP